MAIGSKEYYEEKWDEELSSLLSDHKGLCKQRSRGIGRNNGEPREGPEAKVSSWEKART